MSILGLCFVNNCFKVRIFFYEKQLKVFLKVEQKKTAYDQKYIFMKQVSYFTTVKLHHNRYI